MDHLVRICAVLFLATVLLGGFASAMNEMQPPLTTMAALR
jgi:hypothetical protein